MIILYLPITIIIIIIIIIRVNGGHPQGFPSGHNHCHHHHQCHCHHHNQSHRGRVHLLSPLRGSPAVEGIALGALSLATPTIPDHDNCDNEENDDNAMVMTMMKMATPTP